MYFSSDCASALVDELTSETVLIYPNPAKNHITVNLNGIEETHTILKIYDLSGKVVFEKRFTSTTSLDVSNFAKGVYTLEVSNSDKVVRSKVVLD
jgi:hypothetical protein